MICRGKRNRILLIGKVKFDACWIFRRFHVNTKRRTTRRCCDTRINSFFKKLFHWFFNELYRFRVVTVHSILGYARFICKHYDIGFLETKTLSSDFDQKLVTDFRFYEVSTQFILHQNNWFFFIQYRWRSNLIFNIMTVSMHSLLNFAYKPVVLLYTRSFGFGYSTC